MTAGAPAFSAVALLWVFALRVRAQLIECHPERVKLCQPCNRKFAECISEPSRASQSSRCTAKLKACSPCRPYANCSRVCHIGEEQWALPIDTRCTFGSKRHILDHITRVTMNSGYNHRTMLPALNAAKHISATTFVTAPRVNVASDAVGEYKIVQAQPLLGPFLELYRTRLRVDAAVLADKLMDFVLPHIHLDGRRLDKMDLLYYGFNLDRGAYYPDVHWDTDWNMFPGAAGFQVWYMLEEPDPRLMGDWGNMFLVRTPELLPSDMPLYWKFQPDGSLTKQLHLFSSMPPIKGYPHWQDANMTFEYLALKPGEVLVFSKRTLHFSDPRPHMHNLPIDRLVMNMRIVVKDKWGVPFQPEHPYVTNGKIPPEIQQAWTGQAPGSPPSGLPHMQGMKRYDWLFGLAQGVNVSEPTTKFNLAGQALEGVTAACLTPLPRPSWQTPSAHKAKGKGMHDSTR